MTKKEQLRNVLGRCDAAVGDLVAVLARWETSYSALGESGFASACRERRRMTETSPAAPKRTTRRLVDECDACEEEAVLNVPDQASLDAVAACEVNCRAFAGVDHLHFNAPTLNENLRRVGVTARELRTIALELTRNCT